MRCDNLLIINQDYSGEEEIEWFGIKGKVKFIYRGKVSDEEIKRYREVKEYRAKYRKLLSQVKKQIRFLRSTLRGKESV